MNNEIINGVVPILITPFDSKGRIDKDSLQSLIEYNISAGAHGLGIAVGSEIFKLNETERELVTKIVVNTVSGRIPVVVNTGASGTDLAIKYSKSAQDLGANILMVIPPNFLPVGPQEISDYYKAINNEVEIPIMLQDFPQSPISPSLALNLQQQCKNILYIKVESLPSTIKVAEMVTHVNKQLTIFGGAGGSYFIEELRRGSKGTMPFCSQTKKFIEVWNCFQNDNENEARIIFNKYILPVNRLETQSADLFYHFHKQFLVQLKIIENAYIRGPTMTPDQISQKEIDATIEYLKSN